MKHSFTLAVTLLAAVMFLPGCSRGGKDTPAATPEKQAPAEEEAGPRVSRDTNGSVIISMSDEAQGDLGILVKKPEVTQMSPELKGYGRVLDPMPLVGLMNELAAAKAAYTASSNELVRLKTLSSQGNASAKALQTAEAAASRDQLAVQSAKDRLEISWGKLVSDQPDLPTFIQSLTALQAVLVRIDVPLGESLTSLPTGARLVTLSGRSQEAQFLGPAPSVDPQMQGQGFIFLLTPNPARLAPGAALTGYLKIPGEPVTGVVIPRDAVVRAEGAGWVYVHMAGGEAFTRAEVALDHPIDAGWFVTKGVTANDYIVVTGAQQLLSLESKGQGGE